MRRALICCAVLITACKIDLDHREQMTSDSGGGGAVCMTSTAAACMDATTHSDFTWIQDNVLSKQCAFTGCHNGGSTDAGRLDFRSGAASYMHLVNFDSRVASGRKLVVPGSVNQSYLAVMLGMIKPSEADPPAGAIPETIGLMPMDNNGALLCCQKLDAIDRWITMGAMNN